MSEYSSQSTNQPTKSDEREASSLEGISLLRDQLLPSLLGKETSALLYWAGKEMARQSPLKDLDEVIDFFETRQFGSLQLIKQEKKKVVFRLAGEIISHRLQTSEVSFSLEAGFLAQQYQSIHMVYCEAEYTIIARKKHVELYLMMDPKQAIPFD